MATENYIGAKNQDNYPLFRTNDNYDYDILEPFFSFLNSLSISLSHLTRNIIHVNQIIKICVELC